MAVVISKQLKVRPISVRAGDLDIGESVFLMENGSLVEYLVVHQGLPDNSTIYDASCSGTWLLRKDCYTTIVWDSSDDGYNQSSVHQYLNNTFAPLLGTVESETIKTVKIPHYGIAGSNREDRTGSKGVSAKVFLISAFEAGFENDSGVESTDNDYMFQDGCVLQYFSTGSRIAYYNGSAVDWWVRTRVPASTSAIYIMASGDDFNDGNMRNSRAVRPAVIVPFDALFDTKTLTLKGVL